MSRYMIGAADVPKPEKGSKKEPIRILPKAGAYQTENLQGIKKIISPNGGRR